MPLQKSMDEDTNRLVSTLGLVPSLGAAGLLAFSVLYDFFFFRQLGLSFTEVPTELSDHFRSAFLWAPIVGTIFLAATIYVAVTPGASAPGGALLKRNWPTKLSVAVVTIAFLIPILLGTTSQVVLSFCMMGLGFTAARVLSNASLTSRQRLLASVLGLFVLVALWVVEMGSREGERMFQQSKARWLLTVKATDDITSDIRALGVRRLGAIALVVTEKGTVLVLPGDRVQRASLIEPLTDIGPRQSLLCRIHQPLCRVSP
jgi:hypothetical protein